MREALANQNFWVQGALACKEWEWDGDQIESAEGCLAYAQETLSLPNLASPVLNKIKAEAYREAAEIAGPEDSYQDQWFKAKSDSCAKLLAKADELEQQCAP